MGKGNGNMSITKKMAKVLAMVGTLSVLWGVINTANADEKAAEDCLKDKIWNGYSDGWAVRTATTTSLKQEEHRVYLVTLYAGNEYKIQVCADKVANNIDLILHDLDGNEILRDEVTDREPIITYKPSETQTYYIAVYAADVQGEGASAGVALAVTYR
jgi:hypothetical protein